jgi:hypothetical protein
MQWEYVLEQAILAEFFVVIQNSSSDTEASLGSFIHFKAKVTFP